VNTGAASSQIRRATLNWFVLAITLDFRRVALRSNEMAQPVNNRRIKEMGRQ